MFSGKSEELVRRLRRAAIARQTVQVFKPVADTRHDPQRLITRDKRIANYKALLSAEPSEKNVRREIGVFLRSPGAARRVIEKFQFECNAS